VDYRTTSVDTGAIWNNTFCSLGSDFIRGSFRHSIVEVFQGRPHHKEAKGFGIDMRREV
jgi:hypothetical protein